MTSSKILKGGIDPNLPATIPDLQFWLDADDASTITFGTSPKVAAWKDKSANAFSFTQSTPASQPTRVLDGIKTGRYSMQFGMGVSTPMRGAPATVNTKPFTAIAVIKLTTGSTYNALIATDSSGGMNWQVANELNKQQLNQHYVAVIGSSTSTVSRDVYHIVSLSYSATGQYTFSIDGLFSGGTNDKPFNASVTTTVVGDGLGQAFYGHIGEIIKYARDLTLDEWSALYAYLNAKWDPVAPPAEPAKEVQELWVHGVRGYPLGDPAPQVTMDTKLDLYRGDERVWPGADGYAQFNAGTSNYLETPYRAEYDFASSCAVIVRYQPFAWNVVHALVGQENAWSFGIDNQGYPIFYAYNTSNVAILSRATATLNTRPLVTSWLAAEFVASTNVKFWTSPDGVNWNALGAAVATAFTKRTGNTGTLRVGRTNPGYTVCSGRISHVSVRTGLTAGIFTGTEVFRMDRNSFKVGQRATILPASVPAATDISVIRTGTFAPTRLYPTVSEMVGVWGRSQFCDDSKWAS